MLTVKMVSVVWRVLMYGLAASTNYSCRRTARKMCQEEA